MPGEPTGDTSHLPRLRWQCRRGMRELDMLLLRYLESDYRDATEQEKAAFEQVLALSDPELIAYLLQRERCERAAIKTVVERIRR